MEEVLSTIGPLPEMVIVPSLSSSQFSSFPHFPEPERLIAHLAGLLTPGGTLTVAHGLSRSALDAHHEKTARAVSNGLLPVETLAGLFAKHLTVTVRISDGDMYQVVGQRRL